MRSGNSDGQRSAGKPNLLGFAGGPVLVRAPIIFSPFVLVGLVAKRKDAWQPDRRQEVVSWSKATEDGYRLIYLYKRIRRRVSQSLLTS